MAQTAFLELNLDPQIQKAIDEMGFTFATPIQASAIPVLRDGVDVTARSQTGTGKTMAFAIPALEKIDVKKNAVQVLFLCPTRELAQQAADEVAKLARFSPGVRVAVICGGADMDRQFTQLRRANLVIGTPGRIMDHMRRSTLKLAELQMIVLDEADEMLDMGFKEDIETILRDTPEERQTVLFSATMPDAILSIAKEFQTNPRFIESEQSEEMVANIHQSYVDAPAGHKTDALTQLLRYHRPQRAILFCNTKSMVDELTEHLNANGFTAEGLHGDMKQSQRSHVMNGFKQGKVSILVATDIAARGIDVNDVDYVINYDIPKLDDYYTHRIGRTARAGKSGYVITICSGARQTSIMRNLCRRLKAEAVRENLPTAAEIREIGRTRDLNTVETALAEEQDAFYAEMLATLCEKGFTAEQVAAAMLQLHFKRVETEITFAPSQTRAPAERGQVRRLERSPRFDRGDRGSFERAPFERERRTPFADVVVDIGASGHVAPNHLVGAITERTGLSGKQIGKIEISQDFSVVGVPAEWVARVVASMEGCKVCGRPTHTVPLSDIRLKKKDSTKKPYAPRKKFDN